MRCGVTVYRALLFLLALLFPAFELWSLNWNASFDVLSGYRRDRITTSMRTFNSFSQLTETNKLIVDGLDIIEFGLRARITAAECWSLRCFAGWGVIADGTFHENLADTGSIRQKTTANLLGRLSQDDSISLGYAYPLQNDLTIEGLVGWSYDRLTLKMHDFKEDGRPDSTVEKLYYRMQWKGPWVGCAFTYFPGAFCLYTGYEFHRPYWKAKYWLSGYKLSTQAFSDERWAKNTQGHVVFVDLSYAVLCHCTIGLRAQYQYWMAKNGHSKSLTNDFELIGIPAGQFSRVSQATWSSVGIQLNLGVVF